VRAATDIELHPYNINGEGGFLCDAIAQPSPEGCRPSCSPVGRTHIR
jgi:hypothetical protein